MGEVGGMAREFGAGTPYEFVQVIGRGASGVVWRAVDRRTGVEVAVKVLTAPDEDLQALLRFVQERHVRVDHPNVVAPLGGYDDGNVRCLSMELVRGATLDRFLRENPSMEPAHLASLFADLLEGIAHVHRSGIVHRDIKPSNVLVDVTEDGARARIGDFGSALAEGSLRLTGPASLVGTLGFVAPEAVANGHADALTDLFALGVTARWAVNERPDPGDEPLRAWAERLCAPERSDRPASAAAALDELRAAVAPRRCPGGWVPVPVWPHRPGTADPRSPGSADVGPPGAGALAEPLASSRRSGAPLVGRDEELARLRRLALHAAHGDGQAVLVAGGVGVGKTRLVGEFLASLDTTTPTIRIVGRRGPVRAPFIALRELVTQVLEPVAPPELLGRMLEVVEAVDPELLRWTPLLADAIGEPMAVTPELADLDPRYRRDRLVDLLRSLMETVLPAGSVIVFDDADALDDASAALLMATIRQLASSRLVVMTARDAGFGSTMADVSLLTVPLGVLGDGDVSRLLEAIGVSAARRPVVVARAGGNPFFAHELARAGEGTLPSSIEAAIVDRLDRLSASERTMVDVAAVMGGGDADLVAAVAGARTADRFDGWRAVSGVIRIEDGTVVFEHELFREAALERLGAEARRAIHRRVCRVLEGDGALLAGPGRDLVSADHSLAAGDDRRIWRYQRSAAETAATRYAFEDAIARLESAVAAATRLGDVGRRQLHRCHVRCAEWSELIGRFDDARRHLDHAEPLVSSVAERLRLHRVRSSVLRSAGDYTAALAVAEESLVGRARTSAERSERDRLEIERAKVLHRTGRYEDCLDALAGVIGRADRLPAGVRADAFDLWDGACIDGGRPAGARYGLQALHLYEAIGDLRGITQATNEAGIDAIFAGEFDEAFDWFERSRVAGERIGDRVSVATAINNGGEVRSDQGRLDEAHELFDAAVAMLRSESYPIGIAYVVRNLGRLAGRRGDVAAAAQLFEEAIDRFGSLGADRFVAQTELWWAEEVLVDARRKGVPIPEGDRFAPDSFPDVAGLADLAPVAMRLRGIAALVAGDREDALTAFRRAVDLARISNQAFEEALALFEVDRLVYGGPRGCLPLFELMGVVETAWVWGG